MCLASRYGTGVGSPERRSLQPQGTHPPTGQGTNAGLSREEDELAGRERHGLTLSHILTRKSSVRRGPDRSGRGDAYGCHVLRKPVTVDVGACSDTEVDSVARSELILRQRSQVEILQTPEEACSATATGRDARSSGADSPAGVRFPLGTGIRPTAGSMAVSTY